MAENRQLTLEGILEIPEYEKPYDNFKNIVNFSSVSERSLLSLIFFIRKDNKRVVPLRIIYDPISERIIEDWKKGTKSWRILGIGRKMSLKLKAIAYYKFRVFLERSLGKEIRIEKYEKAIEEMKDIICISTVKPFEALELVVSVRVEENVKVQVRLLYDLLSDRIIKLQQGRGNSWKDLDIDKRSIVRIGMVAYSMFYSFLNKNNKAKEKRQIEFDFEEN